MTFDVDHLKLQRGIYLSESKVIGNKEIQTYDIRVCRPYTDKVMSDYVMHSIEHILAVKLTKLLKEKEGYYKVYFGPMGCCTGFYLLVETPIGDTEPEKWISKCLNKACLDAIREESVPFNSKVECGNNRTLVYDSEVGRVLSRIAILSTNVNSNGLDKYPYIEEPSVLVAYEVNFSDRKVTVRTNELSYDEVKELARESGTAERFVKNLEEFIKNS